MPTAQTPYLRNAAVFVLIALVFLLAAGALLYRYRVNRQSSLTEKDTVVLARFRALAAYKNFLCVGTTIKRTLVE